ncbi:MAG: HAMP domain-containing histidine kinase [Anaerolineaceae bacterium]|nr:HAMP domain-containing histidine kinase [Anaerolineaceae bacterium]
MVKQKATPKPFGQDMCCSATQISMLHHYLTEAASTVNAGWASIAIWQPSSHTLTPIVMLDTVSASAGQLAYLDDLVAQQFASTPTLPPRLLLDSPVVQPLGFAAGLLLFVPSEDDMVGVVTLLGQEASAFTEAAIAGLSPLATLLEISIENALLKNRIATAQAIQAVAQAVTRNPSSQDLLDALREWLFGPQVTLAALLLYGQDNDFDYVETQGTWSRRYGSGIARGIKFYLQNYQELLQQLNQDGIVTFCGIRPLRDHFDPFVRGFFRLESVHSVALVALHTAGRRFGLLVLGSRERRGFDQRELNSYRTVSEFLALNTLTWALQHENDIESRARRSLLDSVADGVLMVMPSHREHYVLIVNKPFNSLFNLGDLNAEGMPLAELLGKMRIPNTIREDLRDQWRAISHRDIGVYTGEFDMTHEGTLATIQWYSAPVYHEKAVFGRIFTFHDVSPERAASRLRANFVSRVSHELRTPLTSIQGFADFILQASGDQLPDVAREYTEIILSSARHLNMMFSEIIDLARADVGEMKLNFSAVHIPDVVIDVVALLEMQYKARNQQVLMELDDDSPPVQADMPRIRQVLTNLLTNAIKYSPPETQIKVITHIVETADDLPPDAPSEVVIPAILVTVTDQGPGFAADEAEKLFTPFYRTAAARASRTEGTGLGLAVSRSIIERHRGCIWAESRRRGRRGSRFHFTLPISE